jgi:hypothetical protein
MIKLNLGAGYKRIPGFYNVDSFAGCNPDYLCDIERETFPFDDSSVDEILAHHILEHIGEGFFHTMKEIYRVCAAGATINIRVPHPRHDTFLIDPTHRRPIYPDTIDMFSKERNRKHIERGSCETPIGLINDVDIRVTNWTYDVEPMYAKMFQTISNEQADFIVRSQNNVLLEIIIEAIVVK